jgi:hypothetical protein
MISNCCNIYDHINPLLSLALARDRDSCINFVLEEVLPYVILFSFTLDRTIFLMIIFFRFGLIFLISHKRSRVLLTVESIL